MPPLLQWFHVLASAAAVEIAAPPATWASLLGDPGMRSREPSTAWTGWSFCNQAAAPLGYPSTPSPRMADCAGRVTPQMNALGPGDALPGFSPVSDADAFARDKELYLGKACSLASPRGNYTAAWSVMFKSGNMDTDAKLCKCVVAGCGHMKAGGSGAMNQPAMVHKPSAADGGGGFFAGTYDVAPNMSSAALEELKGAVMDYASAWAAYRADQQEGKAPKRPETPPLLSSSSFLFTSWYRNKTSGGLVYFQGLQTSGKYPWLMNYLRINSVHGGYGGYPWNGAGGMFGPAPASARMLATLRVLDSGGPPKGQFYLPEIAGCWKLDGSPCDGDLSTDVTRYICFVVTPKFTGQCSRSNQGACPPYHVLAATGERVFRNDTERFPYQCYHMHCYAPNDPAASTNGGHCDPYSNPIPQELLQILPCEEWGHHGFPSQQGQGWTGDSRAWKLDVGSLGAQVFLSGAEPQAAQGQASGRLPSGYPGRNRSWLSFEIGPEVFTSRRGLLLWEVEAWDVQVPA